ncbi:hypothetical protein VCUG_00576 [Vavraia culicis subsp. floridensis]|uniref:Uncharacterized protein n=1 Tax=Vavraia culicis (isolate floridensis) TaxID=948595 RepID=L2GXI4_VAVCU|nr:uncharacterized protein VCUG_00576 [Vavraia culicis subsp. floridensis]ELA47993.1 hypothetical protein VCUG_00576 [Vavraia culicis subsp. floridensis]
MRYLNGLASLLRLLLQVVITGEHCRREYVNNGVRDRFEYLDDQDMVMGALWIIPMAIPVNGLKVDWWRFCTCILTRLKREGVCNEYGKINNGVALVKMLYDELRRAVNNSVLVMGRANKKLRMLLFAIQLLTDRFKTGRAEI